MGTERIERILRQKSKDILTGMTFAIKEIGGSYRHRPVEEIYTHNEIYFRAHEQNLINGDFQPLVDFADMITRKRALDHFRLHELLRAAYSYKKVIYPILVEQCWEDKNALIRNLVFVDKSVDRFVVNLAQAFVHYAKDYIVKDPLEFPVWVDNLWQKTSRRDS